VAIAEKVVPRSIPTSLPAIGIFDGRCQGRSATPFILACRKGEQKRRDEFSIRNPGTQEKQLFFLGFLLYSILIQGIEFRRPPRPVGKAGG
jgi:hypothetical protein